MAYLTPQQYAEHWNLTYSFVNRCIHNGRLQAVKIGKRTYRIDEDEPIDEVAIPRQNIVRAKDFLEALKNV